MIKLLLCVAACALPLTASSEPPKVSNGMIVNDEGMTLYTFDKDTMPGKSACTGPCASLWPTETADSYDKPSGDWTFLDAPGGKHQWAYKGHPLYRYANDKHPGEAAGDGFKGVWHTAKP
jgi:predicted lipoprotein with Yx(FWY)xxD motif